MPFEPAVQRAAREAEALRRIAHVARRACKRFLNQQALDISQAHLIERRRARAAPAAAQSEVSGPHRTALRHDDRPLDHAVERAVIMTEGGPVRARDFGLGGGGGGAGAAALDQMSLGDVERLLIQKALTRAAGHVSDAAKGLCLSRSALYRRLKRHGL